MKLSHLVTALLVTLLIHACVEYKATSDWETKREQLEVPIACVKTNDPSIQFCPE